MRNRLFAVLMAAGVVGVASCGGGPAGEPELVGLAGRPAGGAGTGGAATGGRAGEASEAAGGRGGAPGGRGGSGGNAGKGGSAPAQAGRSAGGSAGERIGQAGETEPGGAGGEGGDAPHCVGNGSYGPGYLGHHCDSTWSYAQGAGMIKVEGATTIEDCMEACDARADCTAVSDYFAQRTGHGCYVVSSPCERSTPGWAGEDGGLEYVKVCSAPDACHLEFLGHGVRCDENGGGRRHIDTTSFTDCAVECIEDPTCVSTLDYTYLEDVVGCFINVASCDTLVNAYEEGTVYRKLCE